jgi:phosphoglycerate dehydrogenase-like enzyme
MTTRSPCSPHEPAASCTASRLGQVPDQSPDRPRVVLAMSQATRAELVTPALAERLEAAARVDLETLIQDFSQSGARPALEAADVLLTGWGAPYIDAAALNLMPRLRAIVHAAGTVKPFVSDEVYARDIQVCSAVDANAVPVAEFTFAAIVFAAKRVSAFAREYRSRRDLSARHVAGLTERAGTNGITVGVVGASRVGRRVLALLRNLDVFVLVSDPYLSDADAAAMGATRTDLDELIGRSDIVTLHAPALPETARMIDRDRLAALADGAVLINTARGALVDTDALTAELASGRISAVLDVTDPEPLPPDSPLYELPNVQLTPHIAGSVGNEVPRLLEYAIAEIERLAAGLPLRYPVLAGELPRMA